MATHDVFNQPPPLVGYNLFEADPTLKESVRREGAAWAEPQLREFGALMGSEDAIAWGFLANENPPKLRTHDRHGHRIDEVDFHPAWHELLRVSMANRLHNLPWTNEREGAHVARAALVFLASENEFGHLCPISMTYSVVPAIRHQAEVAEEWEPRIGSTDYDPRFRPASEKSAVLLGMAMTEKQGGSDVRANTTRATAIGKGGPGAEYRLTGHKWFCSAPMCDAFLVLAQTSKGLSCFLLPRWTPDGRRNHFFIQRLKDKLGNRSNASSEIELHEAWARLIGEEGRGIATIIEMVNHTRLDCVLASAGMMRQAVSQAIHHAAHRTAFGKLLIDQPMMRNVLADLTVESEAATLLAIRLARGYDRGDDEPEEAAFRRLATAVGKYWVCKRSPVQVGEALECLGGNGYVEESIMPRLYREVPLNSIWEGSGNVICLDVLRAIDKQPSSLEALLNEIELGRGSETRFDRYLGELKAELEPLGEQESAARRIVERLALALQGSLLLRFGDPAVADAFLMSRLSGGGSPVFGTLPAQADFDAILDRARSGLC